MKNNATILNEEQIAVVVGFLLDYDISGAVKYVKTLGHFRVANTIVGQILDDAKSTPNEWPGNCLQDVVMAPEVDAEENERRIEEFQHRATAAD
jgi:hypothetical protein